MNVTCSVIQHTCQLWQRLRQPNKLRPVSSIYCNRVQKREDSFDIIKPSGNPKFLVLIPITLSRNNCNHVLFLQKNLNGKTITETFQFDETNKKRQVLKSKKTEKVKPNVKELLLINSSKIKSTRSYITTGKHK